MASHFTIQHDMDKGVLRIKPKGNLDGSTAWQIIHRINDLDDGHRQIVIDTNRLSKIFPFGTQVLKRHIPSAVINSDRVFFTGEKGEEIAPTGYVSGGNKKIQRLDRIGAGPQRPGVAPPKSRKIMKVEKGH